MEQTPAAYDRILERLRAARKQQRVTQGELASRMNVTAGQVSRWESGANRIPAPKLLRWAAALGLDPTALMLDAQQDGPVFPNAVPFKMEGASEERMREDLPIFGTALGGDLMVDGEAIEQTMLNRGEAISYAKRPVILNGNAKAYGLYVQGSSMEPVHLDGDLILAERGRPLRIGDDVVVYLRSAGDEDLEDDGSRARRVLVKRLVRRTGSYVELQQFTPAHTFRVDAADILHIDRVFRMVDLIS